VEQRYFDLKILPGNDDHPSHDVAEGQRFVKEVYEALRSGPQWEETLLVVTYDEHGGFYDHVPTPAGAGVVPSPDGIVSAAPFFFGFDRLGARARPGAARVAVDRARDGAARAVGAIPDVGVRALLHPGHRQEALQPQELPHQARRLGRHLRLRPHARHAAHRLPTYVVLSSM
jgi:hypothetical protein